MMANIPAGYEIIPDGYEVVPNEPAEAPQERSALKDAVGGLDAALNMAAGIPSYIYSGYQGLGNLLLGNGIDKAADSVRQTQESNFGFGAAKPFTQSGQEAVDMLGHGTEALKDIVGTSGERVGGNFGRFVGEAGTEALLNFLPLPGGKGVKTLGKGIEKFMERPESSPRAELPKTETKIPEGYETVEPVKVLDEAIQQELPFADSVETIAKEQAAQTPQRDMFVEDPAAYGTETPKAEPTVVPDLPVEQGFKVPTSQRGAIDIRAVEDGFRAFDGDKEVGKLVSNLTPEQSKMLGENASIDIVKAQEKGKGIGGALYSAWEKAHEGRITPSGKTSPDAWNVWKKKYPAKVEEFVRNEASRVDEGASPEMVLGNITDPQVRSEVARQISIPRSQRGGVDFQGISEGLKKFFPQGTSVSPGPIQNIIGKNLIPKDPLPADVLSKALAEGKDANVFNASKYTASGSTLEGMTRRSGLIDGVSKIVQNAFKRADLYTHKTVYPIEQTFKQLSVREIQSLSRVFKEEMFDKQLKTAEQLHAEGFTEKQLQAYADVREMYKNTLHIQNQARESMGLKPVTEKEYYVSSRWQGDFRQPVFDKTGNLIWYIAADSKMGVNKQAAMLKKVYPDAVIDPKRAHKVKTTMSKNDIQSMYTTMLDVLGRDNPAVASLKEAYESAVATESANVAGQQKHFERKANIRGFVGDRPGFDAKKESMHMFEEQFQYAKNAYKWSALQEAAKPIKEILSSDELRAQQPKNVEYAQAYYQNALGHGTAKWVNGIEDAFRELGVSPTVLNKAVGGVKSFFITQKLALSAGYTAANILQTVNTIPHLMDTMVKMGGNPIKAIATGMPLGIAMASGHYIKSLGGDFSGALNKAQLKFFDEAFRYAEDNGVTSRSIYDEAPVSERGPVNSALNVLGKTMTIPETFVRSVSYMTFVQMLKDTGKFKENGAIFQKAEELTNAAMVDYRTSERPMMFSKLGVAGNALNTLQTFPMNFYNQYRYFGKEAMRGNVAPFAALLAVQYAMAGASGIPGFSDVDKLWGVVKGSLPDSMYSKVAEFDPKLWMIENLGEASVYGAVSTQSGVNMTGRLSAPGASDMIQAPGGPLVDLAKQAGSVGSALIDPTSTNIAQAVHDVTPTGLQGLMETKVFKDENAIQREGGKTLYKKASDLSSRTGQYARTPEEEKLRSFGVRSQREALSNDVQWKAAQMEKQTTDRSKGLVEKFYDALRRGDEKRMKNINELYTKINGSSINDEQINNQLMQEYTTMYERKATSPGQKMMALKNLARVKKLMEEHDK